MKTMKQWFLLAFSAILCAAMVACADKDASSSQAASSVPSSSSSASSVMSESASASASSSSQSASENSQPAKAQDAYTAAIVGARDQELNDSYPVIGAKPGESAMYTNLPASMEDDGAAAQMADMVLQTLLLTPDQLQQYAFSISLINVKAYGVGVFMPAEGQTEAVKAALQDFVTNQQKSFQNYLADQYEIAKQAKVEVLPTGEVVLVMCENSDQVLSAIQAALQ